MIPHFFLSVNTHFARRNPVDIRSCFAYYYLYSCMISCILLVCGFSPFVNFSFGPAKKRRYFSIFFYIIRKLFSCLFHLSRFFFHIFNLHKTIYNILLQGVIHIFHVVFNTRFLLYFQHFYQILGFFNIS